MKITDIKTFTVGNPPPGFGGRYYVFIKLITDSGIEGVGEIYNLPFHPHIVEKMARDVVERYVVGQDPFDTEKIFRSVYGGGFIHRPDISMMGILSAIDMACWDIKGKELNKPVYKLLGGQVHEKLRSYTYIYPKPGDKTNVYLDPELAAVRAQEYVEMGFTAVKFDPAGPYTVYDGRQLSLQELDRSERFCKLLREAVGSKADLLFGTHGQMTASGAIRLAKRLEQYDPLWLEEPIPPDNQKEMAKVARATSIPIAAGERLSTKWEYLRLLEDGAASILQMNLARVGGITEAKKIASMAEAFHAQIAPHIYCGPITWAAAIQVSTSTPNFLILETIYDGSGFYSDLLKTPLQWQDGYIVPPTAPGLGVELNEAVALAHPYEGNALHLDMTHTPAMV
ncbi:MAG: mandelate racemase/muconate lactonizing enzyme family protein [Phycisphaerae bacterium]